VTWGERHEESYGRTLELVARAEAYLAQRERPQPNAASDLDAAATEALLLTLRGALSRDGRRVLHVDRGQRAIADRADVEQVATAARATPDHMLRIGARSLVVSDSGAIGDAVAAYAEAYEAYFARHRHRLPDGLGMLSPLPRVALVPGLGCVAAGPNAAAARVNAEIAARSHLVTARTLDAFGAIDWLSEEEIFDFEYWPLELYKLQSAPLPRPLSGQIAIVRCGEVGLAQAVATRLAQDGAHLLLAGPDPDALRRIADTLPRATTRIAGGEPVATAIGEFGGVDLFVALDVPRETDLDRLRTAVARQGVGGAIVGLERADGATVDRDSRRANGMRVNLARIADGADPGAVADVIAFLASAAAIDGAVVPVGV
ncbi:MAG TPA: hypothetical protein VFU81_19095, partial [Thermomicrobiales bacterium]|nr:hypothetical protein [Thermomicrobiales bacterium]